MILFTAMRRIGLALLVSAGLVMGAALPASAQSEISPEHLAIAREYVELSDRAAIYELGVIELGTAVMRTLIQQNPDLADTVAETVRTVANEYVGEKDQIYNQFARVYASRFTEAELQEIVDFYTTPTGEKLLAQNMGVNRDIANVLQLWESNARTEFMSRVRTSLREQGHNM